MVRRRGGTASADPNLTLVWLTHINPSFCVIIFAELGQKLHIWNVSTAQAVCPYWLLMSFEPRSAALFFQTGGTVRISLFFGTCPVSHSFTSTRWPQVFCYLYLRWCSKWYVPAKHAANSSKNVEREWMNYSLTIYWTGCTNKLENVN